MSDQGVTEPCVRRVCPMYQYLEPRTLPRTLMARPLSAPKLYLRNTTYTQSRHSNPLRPFFPPTPKPPTLQYPALGHQLHPLHPPPPHTWLRLQSHALPLRTIRSLISCYMLNISEWGSWDAEQRSVSARLIVRRKRYVCMCVTSQVGITVPSCYIHGPDYLDSLGPLSCPGGNAAGP